MDRIKNAFDKDHKVFIPYLTMGFPSVEKSLQAANIAVQNGADIIELGFPFSDPTADGTIIQTSSQFALDNGFSREDYFSLLKQIRLANQDIPIVVFSYYNPIFHFGAKPFVKRIKELGADAILIVDLPLEEQNEIRPILDEFQIHLIQLIAPTTPEKRVREIVENASGFIYQISLKGVTGVRDALALEIEVQLKKIRNATDLPVVLGFGISTTDQIEEIGPLADGIVVGSAVVQTILDQMPEFEVHLEKRISQLASAVHNSY